jgi:tryptophan 2,3-dioxygenase
VQSIFTLIVYPYFTVILTMEHTDVCSFAQRNEFGQATGIQSANKSAVPSGYFCLSFTQVM